MGTNLDMIRVLALLGEMRENNMVLPFTLEQISKEVENRHSEITRTLSEVLDLLCREEYIIVGYDMKIYLKE